ncbi:MAG: hypothetical protein ABF649_22760 [Bacillus sp. (in: firmicutes)]
MHNYFTNDNMERRRQSDLSPLTTGSTDAAAGLCQYGPVDNS